MSAVATPKFVDTPPTKKSGPKSRFIKHAEILRENQGKWALIGKYKSASSANSVGYLIRNGKHAAFGDGFESTIRGSDLYVRFVGAE